MRELILVAVIDMNLSFGFVMLTLMFQQLSRFMYLFTSNEVKLKFPGHTMFALSTFYYLVELIHFSFHTHSRNEYKSHPKQIDCVQIKSLSPSNNDLFSQCSADVHMIVLSVNTNPKPSQTTHHIKSFRMTASCCHFCP
ncbi:CLUMA_CG014551, isoform A [Clunio marinus]|uniref:CLUMA_CG014551, isoform A n=1 Tax=Clunio marinus TaxID=568069 RepID=A0A1J1INN3_9DIPT|nr:CLUMA_CG014551, isoform A [Clunio marinus]